MHVKSGFTLALSFMNSDIRSGFTGDRKVRRDLTLVVVFYTVDSAAA
jgi:hypothetical protein